MKSLNLMDLALDKKRKSKAIGTEQNQAEFAILHVQPQYADTL